MKRHTVLLVGLGFPTLSFAALMNCPAWLVALYPGNTLKFSQPLKGPDFLASTGDPRRRLEIVRHDNGLAIKYGDEEDQRIPLPPGTTVFSQPIVVENEHAQGRAVVTSTSKHGNVYFMGDDGALFKQENLAPISGAIQVGERVFFLTDATPERRLRPWPEKGHDQIEARYLGEYQVDMMRPDWLRVQELGNFTEVGQAGEGHDEHLVLFRIPGSSIVGVLNTAKNTARAFAFEENASVSKAGKQIAYIEGMAP